MAELARRATVSMTYNGKSASQMMPYLQSFKYTDVASGESDSIAVELADRDRLWIGSWCPKKSDRLVPKIIYTNWDAAKESRALSCGTFIVDDYSFKGGPIVCTIKALAIPSTSGFKATARTYTYENLNLREIGERVASRAGLKLYYDAGSPPTIESVAQDNETDCSFYNSLVEKYGLSLKIYNDRLVVLDEGTYEAKAAVATLTEKDFETGWQWNTTTAGTYTGVKYQYTHTEKNQTFTVIVGGGERVLTCNDEANNLTEATLIALAKLNDANKQTTTMKITLKGTWKIRATDCVAISGLGKIDGKYFVESAETSIGSGATTVLNLRRVETRFKKSQASVSSKAAESGTL